MHGLRVVREGLKGTEKIIIRGLQRVRPDVKANATLAEIKLKDDDGLPDSYVPVPEDQWISRNSAAVDARRRRSRHKLCRCQMLVPAQRRAGRRARGTPPSTPANRHAVADARPPRERPHAYRPFLHRSPDLRDRAVDRDRDPGRVSYWSLPAAQYPDVVPPTIVVRASYPGASPEVIAETVATPIEQEVNGVEDMLYMSSQCTMDGAMTLTITFRLGTDLDKAQVLVQNRVAVAEPRLPEDVRRLGITTLKSSPDLLMVVHLISPDNRYDQLYIGNYALIQVRDTLARVDGVGDVTPFGLREYSMRIWLDPERMAHLSLTPGDVLAALREQNVQVASGVIGQPPVPKGQEFQTHGQHARPTCGIPISSTE